MFRASLLRRAFPFRLTCLFSLLVIYAPNALAQAPDALFVVRTLKNGSGQSVEDPATSWNYNSNGACDSAVVTYNHSGSGSGTSLNAQLGNTVIGATDFCNPSVSYEVDVYVRGTATSTVTIQSSGNVSVETSGTPAVQAHFNPPWASTTSAMVSPGPGSASNSGGASPSRFTNIWCSGSNSPYCRTFSQYPGVTYCIPPDAQDLLVDASTRDDGPTTSTVNLSSQGSVTITVSRGASAPHAEVSGPGEARAGSDSDLL